jgi:hypothetical protein
MAKTVSYPRGETGNVPRCDVVTRHFLATGNGSVGRCIPKHMGHTQRKI